MQLVHVILGVRLPGALIADDQIGRLGAVYPAQVASYQAARAGWQKATDAYSKDLPLWEAAHEKARQCTDRIAFCGQVPANVSGDFEVGDYIIAAASGAGIKAVAVKADT